MRKHGRIDANQPELVAHAEAFGASWVSMANLGNGAPDGLLGHQGHTHVVEFKTPKGTLTNDQREFLRKWNGGPVHILRTTEDVEMLLLGRTVSSIYPKGSAGNACDGCGVLVYGNVLLYQQRYVLCVPCQKRLKTGWRPEP